MTSKHHRKLFALVLIVAALAIPSAASAAPVPATQGQYHGPSTVQAQPVAGDDSGFDWGDAVIGASVGIGALVIGGGSALVVRTLRADRTRIRVTG